MSDAKLASLEKERQARRAKLASALHDEEDPLGVYEECIKWTITNYPPSLIPRSGLLELLEEAGRLFKGDKTYQVDRRYLKIWLTYAHYVDNEHEDPTAEIYKHLLRNNIGTAYAQLYEDYAIALERFGRRQDADKVYRHGIQKRARPVERLKQHYAEFQARSPASDLSSLAPSPVPAAAWNDAPAEVQTLRRYPFKNWPQTGKKPPASASVASASSSAAAPQPEASTSAPRDGALSSMQKHGHDRYAFIMATPHAAASKRKEQLRFDLSLLFTEDGTEYCVQEARAKSMGLLGKKWPPLPPTGAASEKKKVYYEPTVTLATKEALADVFGMYNSPERTLRFGVPAGSKHAPVRKVEPMMQPIKNTLANENARSGGGKLASARVPVNENGGIHGKTRAPFKPFVDDSTQEKPSTQFHVFKDEPQPEQPTPPINPLGTSRSRRALSSKDPEEDSVARKPEPSLLPIFTPVASTHNRPSAPRKESPGRSTSPPPPVKFTPFVDPEVGQGQLSKSTGATSSASAFPNIFTHLPSKAEKPEPPPLSKSESRKPLFTPFVDSSDEPPVPSPPQPLPPPVFGERSRSHTPLQALSTPSTSTDDDADFVMQPQQAAMAGTIQDQDFYDDYESTDESNFDDAPPPREFEIYEDEEDEMMDRRGGEEGEGYEEEEEGYETAPMGGRLGRFNVMTPITERTLEYTHTHTHTHLSSARATPSDGSRAYVVHHAEDHLISAKESADQLAAELAGDGDGFSDDVEEGEEGLEQVEERTGTLSLSDALSAVSSFKPANPCNPFDGSIMVSLLSFIPPDPCFEDLRTVESNQLDGLQRFSKKKARRGSANANTSKEGEGIAVLLGSRQYHVLDKLGEGGFGAVFEAIDVGAARAKFAEDEGLDEDDELDFDLLDEDEIPKVALKVVKPRNLWEFHVLRRLHHALPARVRRSVVLPDTLFAYRDESFLILELCTQGTLLHVVNNAPAAGITQQGACLDELLVMFFTVELLRVLESLHTAGFIHGDVKIDNCLLRLEDVPGGASAWTGVYDPTGEGGWAHKGIKMIDFGRTIDTRMFPPGQRFVGDWDPDARDCLEMREGRPWTYQTDYFGLAGIVYCMLYGKYIEASSIAPILGGDEGAPTRYKLSTPFKRYWQGELWTRLFDLLLNSALARPDGSLPLCDEMGAIREEMETWLQANCNRASNSLKGLLKKIELMTLGGKDGR